VRAVTETRTTTPRRRSATSTEVVVRLLPGEKLSDAMARFERALIEAELAFSGPTEAARALGLTREGLYRARKRLGVGKVEPAPPPARRSRVMG